MKLVDEIRNEVMKLNNKEAYIFIFSLLKRQKSMFDKIASNNKWNNIDVITNLYNLIQKNVKEQQNLFIEDCIDRTDIEYFGWECEEYFMQIVDTFLDTLFAFANQLQDKDDIDYGFTQCNFDLLENILYNLSVWKDRQEETFISNEYVQLEYKREKRDLDLIQCGNYLLDTDEEEMLVMIM